MKRAASPAPRRSILQSGVRIERDPVRVRELVEEKRDENVSLRVFLIERLKAELLARGSDWRIEPEST